MNEEKNHDYKQLIFDFAPLAFIIGALALNWIGMDEHALVTYIGFLLYGLLGLVEHWGNKNPKRPVFKILKTLTLVLIIKIGMISILGNPTYFVALLALVLLEQSYPDIDKSGTKLGNVCTIVALYDPSLRN